MGTMCQSILCLRAVSSSSVHSSWSGVVTKSDPDPPSSWFLYWTCVTVSLIALGGGVVDMKGNTAPGRAAYRPSRCPCSRRSGPN